MKEKKVIVEINAGGKFSFTEKFNSHIDGLEYSENIDFPKTIVFSAKTKNGYITDEPIRKLIFQEGISEITVTIFNNYEGKINGEFILSNINEETTKKFNHKTVSDLSQLDFNIDDIFELGKNIYERELHDNYYINKYSPVLIEYYKVDPEKESEDHILNEYSISNLTEKVCMSLITKDNKLPDDEEAQYTEFGYRYNDMLGSMSKLYFEEHFGVNAQPNAGDYIKFLSGNVMMQITGTRPVRSSNRCIVGWHLSLSHYDKSASVMNDNNVSLETYSETSEERFNRIINEVGEDYTDEKQNLVKYVHHDINREKLSTVVNIVENEEFNYYSIINDVKEENELVVYSGEIDSSGNLAISFNYENIINDVTDENIIVLNDEFFIGIINGVMFLKHYSDTILHPLDLKNEELGWYTYLFNINYNEGKVDLISYNPSKERKQMKKNLSPVVEKKPMKGMILAENSNIGKIRIWKNVIPVEYENRILFRKLVEKPSSAYIIDNCEPILNSRTHKRSDDLIRWKDFSKKRRKIN